VYVPLIAEAIPMITTQQKLYDVLLEQKLDGTYQASIVGWFDCTAIAPTEQEALDQVQTALHGRIAKSKIIQIKANPPQTDRYHHPWMEFAQRLSQNPLLPEVDQFIIDSRQAEQTAEEQ
jgi:predicted RNase H-like HicB family nuclease